ncbi:MAG: DUF1330 domain-containing protein [Bacteroidetes bacterium]|nr:MAG: DUF1330 domain-containing protein [Bacteroidota bacterium]
MDLTNKISPTEAQMKELLNYPADKPVVMVNIVRFKAQTDAGNETGAEAYARYMKNVAPILQAAGGKLIWRGKVRNIVIGPETGAPDLIFLVQYPSVQHFLGMVTSPEYRAVAHDRHIALEYGGLIATEPAAPG